MGADFRTPNDRCNTDNLWNFWLQLCSGLTHNALGGFSIEALVVDGLAVAKLVEGLGELLIALGGMFLLLMLCRYLYKKEVFFRI